MWSTGLLASGLVVAACSGAGDDDSSTAPVPSTTTGAEQAPSASTPATSDAPSTTEPQNAPSTTAAPTTSTTTSTSTTTFPSAAEELGLDQIEQLTPLTGGGEHPVLEWSPVDGAVRYHVVVLAPSGQVYWGWETNETSVPVGGLPALEPGAPGPAVIDGMTWSVSAVDESGHVIALSAHRPIAP